MAASLVWLLQGNAVQRTLAAWHMSWEPTFETSATDWRLPFMIQLLNDNYAATRYVTWQSLMKLPEYQVLQEGEAIYEFVSPAPERVAIQQALMDNWSRKMGDLPISNPQLLFRPNANSQLDSDTLLRLIQNRDNTSILMSE